MLNPDLQRSIVEAWRTNNRITTSLILGVPDRVWEASVPGMEHAPTALAGS